MSDEEMQAEVLEGEASPVESEDSTTSETAAPGDEAQTGEHTDQESEEPKPKRTGFQKRISGLTERLREAEAKLAAAEAEKQAPPQRAAPDRDDFNDYEQFLEARAEWVAEQKFSSLQSEAQARQAEVERHAQQSVVEAQWDEAQELAREKYEDFDDVVYGEVTITEPMALSIKGMKDGAEIAYHLGKNPKDADRIGKLSPIDQVLEMGAIRERLKERTQKQKPPTPISRGRTSQSTGSSALRDDLPIDKWMELRNKQVGRS